MNIKAQIFNRDGHERSERFNQGCRGSASVDVLESGWRLFLEGVLISVAGENTMAWAVREISLPGYLLALETAGYEPSPGLQISMRKLFQAFNLTFQQFFEVMVIWWLVFQLFSSENEASVPPFPITFEPVEQFQK